MSTNKQLNRVEKNTAVVALLRKKEFRMSPQNRNFKIA